jgi:hypothetical protein
MDSSAGVVHSYPMRWSSALCGLLASMSLIAGLGCGSGQNAPGSGIGGQEVLLAVRVDYDIAPDGALLGNQIVLLRNADADWREIDEQPFGPQRYGFREVTLWGTKFSSPMVAWAFGYLGDPEGPSFHETRPGLFRSADAGQTWIDVRDSVPDVGNNRLISDVVFSDSDHGWFVVPPIYTNPTVPPPPDTLLTTADGGRSFSPGGVCFQVLLCAGEARCLFSETAQETVLGPAPGAEAYCMLFDTARLPSFTRRARDIRMDGRGVVCGDRDSTPACAFTRDAGLTWSESLLPGDLVGDSLGFATSVVLTDDGGAWATVGGGFTLEPNAVFLRSEDGGASWRRHGEMFQNVSLSHLSRSTAATDQGFRVAP